MKSSSSISLHVPRRARAVVAAALSLVLAWTACESPSAPVSPISERISVVDTVWLADTVVVLDTVYLSGLPDGDGPTRLAGALAWGGGELIGSSSHLVAALPDGRWGIGTDEPAATLHVSEGDLLVEQDGFRLVATARSLGSNPAGHGLYLNRDRSSGSWPMGITFQQRDLNFWGLGLDENVTQPYPDYVSVFETRNGDIFRFRQGGRAILGNGIGHPEPQHVLTLIDRDNDYIENVLNLQLSPDGSATRFIRAWDNASEQVRFAVGADGRVGVGRNVSSTAELSVQGTAEAYNFRRLSDSRLKVDVRPVEDALERVLSLRPVTFTWRDAPQDGREIGLLAQEVARILPEAVRQNGDGHHTVDYGAVDMTMLRAVQELAEQVRRLEAEVDRLRAGRE